MISGFLITSHIFESLERGQFRFLDFFSRRVRRIFPSLIIVMACSLIFGRTALLADEFNQLGKHVASGAAFITNFILVDESGYFDNSAESKPMLHLWSLAVEEQFYIVWPVVLWMAWRRKLNLLTVTIVALLASVCLNFSFATSHPTESFFLPFFRFWEILSGSILAWVCVHQSKFMIQLKLRVDLLLVRCIHAGDVVADGRTFSNLLCTCGFILLAWGLFTIDENLPFPSKWALLPVLGAVFVIAAGSKACLNRVFLMNPMAVWIGLISYPLYLWHWPIFSFLQIIEGEIPHRDNRITAVLISVLFAWLTYKFIEVPIRFGILRKKLNSLCIALVFFALGGAGYFVSSADWTESNGHEDVIFARGGFNHAFGSSLKWYKGKENWIFLGNDYDQIVAKRRLAIKPSAENISTEFANFEALAQKGLESNTCVALLVGPNKSSVYTEFLPNEMNPSNRRHSTFITDRLKVIPNFEVVDPTDLLVDAKSKEGLLYWRTDSHWNQKGAYVSFCSMMNSLNLVCPVVKFREAPPYRGGLITNVGKNDADLQVLPIMSGDNWYFKIHGEHQIHKEEFKDQPKDAFGWKGKVLNSNPLNDMYVWVIGDSFTTAVRPYIDASFKEVHYVGHWRNHLLSLPAELDASQRKPDLVLVVRVERSF